MDRAAARCIADGCGGARNADRLDRTLGAVDRLLHRAARAGLVGPPAEASERERATLARLAPHDVAARGWARLAQEVADRAAHARAVNVDGAAIMWDALARVDAQARES
jgi:DNA polymerase-3 subunit delta'